MSLRLTFRKARSKSKAKRGSYYIEGTDHKGNRVHESLRTGDRDLAKREFAKRVADTMTLRAQGAKGVVNFANAVKIYTERQGENSNTPYLDEMLPKIGTKKLCELTQADLDQLAKDMRPGVSRATLKRHVYTPFMAAYNAAVDNEPPLADPRRWKTPKVPKRRGEAPPEDYIAALRAACFEKRRTGKRNNVVIGSHNPARDVAAILFITLTGCRTGEAQKLQKGHLSLDRGFARIMDRKNDEPLQVALAPMLLDALKVHVANLDEIHGGRAPDETPVFQFASRWGMPQMIARVRKRAGLRHYRPHQIGRHAFATRHLNNGATLKQVKEAAGWKKITQVDEYYGHLEQSIAHTMVAQTDTSALEKPTPNLHPKPKRNSVVGVKGPKTKGKSAA